LQIESKLVEFTQVFKTPIGFREVKMPFRKPRFLTLGDEKNKAQLYLFDEAADRLFVATAAETGAYGNQIAISARPDGPGRFEVAIHFQGARFENARQTVLGEPASAGTLAPMGILQAKAAGIDCAVTRDGTEG
jgi:hypothetical protein